MLPDKNTTIIRVVLNKFDNESIEKAVGEYVAFPVKIFVNCKTGKKNDSKKKPIDPEEVEKMRKAIIKESIVSNDAQIREIIAEDDDITNFDISTRAEIHFNGKENIEGFVSLVNMFLRSMHMTSKHPCLINVDNTDSNEG